MSIILAIHKRVRRFTPHSFVRASRKFIERYFDKPWIKKHFSQFGEDVAFQAILDYLEWKSGIQAISPSEKFYVNIGAYAPKQHSNTYLLSKQGWKGINVDASPGSMDIFKKVLKDDISIEVLISNSTSPLTFYHWSSPNVMNTVSEEHAKELESRMGTPKTVTMIPKTLADILNENLPAGQSIGLLSLDVENHNLEVLQSNDWSKYCPVFIIVEFEGTVHSIEDILNSELTRFLKSIGYSLCNWVGLSLFFSRKWTWG